MEDSLANWQWLVSLPRRERAVVVESTPAGYSDFLVDDFSRVDRFDPTGWLREPAQRGSEWQSRYGAGTLDCVAVPDVDALVGTHRRSRGAAEALVAIRHALRSGSGMYVGIEAIRRTRSRIGTRFTSRHERQLRTAGFARVRAYYVVQSPAHPRHLVPIVGPSILAWDRAVDVPGARAEVRRMLIRIGLHPLFFRYRLVVGHA